MASTVRIFTKFIITEYSFVDIFFIGFRPNCAKNTATQTIVFTPLNKVQPSLNQFSQNSQLVNGMT
jgi:hypothetical protein